MLVYGKKKLLYFGFNTLSFSMMMFGNLSMIYQPNIYLIFGFFTLCYPLIAIAGICLCLPCLIVIICFFGGSNQKPAADV